MAFQLGVTIFLGVFLGKKLDAYFETEKAYFTILLALVAVVAVLYLILKDIISDN